MCRALPLSRVRLLATPWTVARQAPLSMGFSRQECWSGLPCCPLGDLPNPGMESKFLMSSALAGQFFTTGAPCCCSVTQPCPTLCNPMDCSTPGFLSITNSWSLLKLMSIKSVMPSNHIILCRPLLLLPLIFPSIRVFSNESVLHIRWPEYWSFSFSISPSNEYSGLISFRIDWLDLLAVQGTLKSLLQHHSSKASILQHSAFFIV